MKQYNGFWEDEKGNKWSTDLFSMEDAYKYSETLTRCINCRNCKYCVDCSRCNSCFNCVGCSNCSNCSSCRDCSNCSACSYCKDCKGCFCCRDCRYCDFFCDNPERIIGSAMGSRSDNPAVYWIEAGKEQCVVGCFRGTLDELEKAVEKTHKDNPEYLEQYRKFIKAVRVYQGVMK